MVKFSIIVSIYMVEHYLRRCVDSILKQTFSDFELLLIDDGSKDSCGHICDEYAKLDSRVIVIHQENKGVSAARNAGLDMARGEYVTFIDADDYVEPIFLEELSKEKADMVCQTAVLADEYEKTIFRHHISDKKYEINSIVDCETILDAGAFNWTHCKRLSRSIIEKNHIRFNTSIDFAEDTLFMIQYAKNSNSVITQDIANYHYVVYSSRKTLSNQFSRGRVEIIKKANRLIAKECTSDTDEQERVYCQRMQSHYTYIIQEYIRPLPAKDFTQIIPAWWILAEDDTFCTMMEEEWFIHAPEIFLIAVLSRKKSVVVLAYLRWRVTDIKKRYFSRKVKK